MYAETCFETSCFSRTGVVAGFSENPAAVESGVAEFSKNPAAVESGVTEFSENPAAVKFLTADGSSENPAAVKILDGRQFLSY
jgi:hypothetical protein